MNGRHKNDEILFLELVQNVVDDTDRGNSRITNTHSDIGETTVDMHCNDNGENCNNDDTSVSIPIQIKSEPTETNVENEAIPSANHTSTIDSIVSSRPSHSNIDLNILENGCIVKCMYGIGKKCILSPAHSMPELSPSRVALPPSPTSQEGGNSTQQNTPQGHTPISPDSPMESMQHSHELAQNPHITQEPIKLGDATKRRRDSTSSEEDTREGKRVYIEDNSESSASEKQEPDMRSSRESLEWDAFH